MDKIKRMDKIKKIEKNQGLKWNLPQSQHTFHPKKNTIDQGTKSRKNEINGAKFKTYK